MKNLFYASVVGFTLLCGCSGGSNKDISTSEFYWPPKEVDKSSLANTAFFSKVHENNLGKFVFANEKPNC